MTDQTPEARLAAALTQSVGVDATGYPNGDVAAAMLRADPTLAADL